MTKQTKTFAYTQDGFNAAQAFYDSLTSENKSIGTMKDKAGVLVVWFDEVVATTKEANSENVPFISEGTEYYASGVKDNKGRDCGSSVYYGVYTETDTLSAYVYPNRDGKPFCRNSGTLGKFKTEAERKAWVTKKVQESKDRAAKKWADYN